MNENIIDQVKEILGLNGDYSYIDLLERLSKKRAECHPDRTETSKRRRIQTFK